MIRKAVLLVFMLGLPALLSAQELPPLLQGLGLKEARMASRDLPGWQKPEKVVVHNLFGGDVITPLQAVVRGHMVCEMRELPGGHGNSCTKATVYTALKAF